MTQAWWQRGVVYQLYPRSFKDSNADGIGDLMGVIRKLDYLQWLGVDAIWFSPTFPSPMKDFGYDVADYEAVHPDFGTLADMERLIDEAKERGIRIILDLVPNHTSDQHVWFQQSRSARTNPKRDWYIWHDPAPDGGPPNNWTCFFGKKRADGSVDFSAWEYDEPTGQYYLHSFLPEQPDLNYRNPDVLRAMQDTIAFWLEKDIAGFRVDVIFYTMKDAEFRDNPPNPNYDPQFDSPKDAYQQVYNKSRPEVVQVVRAFREVFDRYSTPGAERVFIGEEEYLADMEYLVRQYSSDGTHNDLQHLPFNFKLLLTPWNARAINDLVDRYDRGLPAFAQPNWVLGNHDMARLGSRIRTAQKRIAAMLLLTLRGTPFIYYGEELGMENVDIPQERLQDPFGINVPGMGRDPERTPMQWDDSPYAGFSTVEPWLPVAPNYAQVNVAVQREDPHSLLNLYHRLLHLRRDTPALHSGRYYAFDNVPEPCFVYMRQYNDQRYLMALNFSSAPQTMTFSGFDRGSVVLSTLLDREGLEPLHEFTLRPDEGCVIELPPETI